MRKPILILLILAAVLLAGCLPQVQATPTPTRPVVAPTAAITLPTQAAVLPSTGCTVVSQKATPGPTPESPFLPVTDKDWVKGPASAKITIIEYSDFQ